MTWRDPHIERSTLTPRSNTTALCFCFPLVQAKLDAGEECLSTALPCDIAGLVKQFFRDLPEPILPAELNEALLKAQQLPAEEDRRSAVLLLSCVLSERNRCVLRHFFDFLHDVSLRYLHFLESEAPAVSLNFFVFIQSTGCFSFRSPPCVLQEFREQDGQQQPVCDPGAQPPSLWGWEREDERQHGEAPPAAGGRYPLLHREFQRLRYICVTDPFN